MSGPVVLVVLFAAFLNAVWNTVVKSGGDKFLSTVLVASGSAVLGGLALPFVVQPAPASWPYLAVSVATQNLFLMVVAATYRAGDISQTYPIMRGTAPLLVALGSDPLIGEALPPTRWLGVGLICLGLLGMAVDTRRRSDANESAFGLALLNAGIIATYTLVDGIGVRASGSAVGYAMWLFTLTVIPILVWTVLRQPAAFLRYAVNRLDIFIIGGIATSGSYGLALWAMTRAPVAAVAALRETSILFAAAISVIWLKERLTVPRAFAIGVIMLGALAIRGG